MTGKIERELLVTVPIRTVQHYLIKTDLTDEELQLKLESAKGNFLEVLHEFEILESVDSHYKDYNDENESEIIDNEGNTIAYYNPNESC